MPVLAIYKRANLPVVMGGDILKSKLRSQMAGRGKKFLCLAKSEVTAWKNWLLRCPGALEDVMGSKTLNFPSMWSVVLTAFHWNRHRTRLLLRRAKN